MRARVMALGTFTIVAAGTALALVARHESATAPRPEHVPSEPVPARRPVRTAPRSRIPVEAPFETGDAPIPESFARALASGEARAGARVRGRLTFGPGPRPSLVRVALVAADDEHPADTGRFLTAEEGAWIEDGDEFALEGVPPGRYLLGVAFCDGTVAPVSTIEVEQDADRVADVAVPALDVHEDVLVRVLEPDGRPARDAEVQAGFRRRDGDSIDLDTFVRVGDDGTVRLRHDAPGAPRTGMAGSERMSFAGDRHPPELTHFVLATSARHPPQRVDYDPRHDREVTIRFVSGAHVKVTLEGLESSPQVDHLFPEIAPTAGGAPIRSTYERDGRFAFNPAPPGDYELRLVLTHRDRAPRLLIRRPLTLAGGDLAISLPVPQFGSLTVTIEDEEDLLDVTLVRVGEGSSERFDSEGRTERGRLVFGNLPSGRYRLGIMNSAGWGEMTFDLTGDAVEAWRPDR